VTPFGHILPNPKVLLHPLQPVFPRERKSVLTKEFELHRDHTIGIAVFIQNHFFEDFIVDSSLSRSPWLASLAIPLTKGDISSFVLIKFCIFDGLYSCWDIDFDRFITSQISSSCDFFFGKRIVDEISSRIVEIEGIHATREEVSEGSFFFHSSEYFFCPHISFFFGVLFIKDAELFVFQSDTS
jgi:hypothetical protein